MFNSLVGPTLRVTNWLFDSEGRMHQNYRKTRLFSHLPAADVECSASACLAYVQQHATRGDAASVIATIHEYADKTMMINVGTAKGDLVDALIREKKPSIMVELGGYAGYSAVRFASLQREVAGTDAHYFSFELSPELAECVRMMVAFAGLSDQVTVITGAFADQIDEIWCKSVDMVFIDHAKSCYAPDTKLILESGTLHNGSLLVADNVLLPGVPEYLAFTESHLQYQTKRLEAPINGSWLFTDALSVAEFQS